MGPVRVMLGALLLIAPLGTARADDGPDVTILSAYRSLAGANGTVSLLIDYEMGCGNGVVLAHPAFRHWTAYCHLTRALVVTGQVVSRGQAIGLSGTSGNSAGIPHVHLEVCTVACASHRDGDLRGTQDPLPLIVGCFEPERAYPTDRLALTWPLGCR